jgi:hypothetical protein
MVVMGIIRQIFGCLYKPLMKMKFCKGALHGRDYRDALFSL